MEGEGTLVLSQAQMDSIGTVEPISQEGVGVTFANEGQPPQSEPHSNGTSGPVDSTTGTQGTPGETRATTSLKARKRTKTGCLTCRKRRIKCGEERPTCSNCVKSKRNCEGYTPRVVFKDPLGSFRPAGGLLQQGHGAQYQHASRQNGATGQYGRIQSTSSSQATLPAIRPRPSVHDGQTELTSMAAATIPDTYNSIGQMHHSKAYPPSDLPPRMRHLYNGQHSFINSNQGMSDTEIRKSMTTKPAFYHQHTSESDSGVDMGPSSLPSDWSHSFSTSYGFPKGYVRDDTRDTTMPITQVPASRHTEPMPYTQFSGEWRGYDDSQSQSTELSPFIDGHWSAIEPPSDEAFFPPETPFQNSSRQTWTTDGGVPPPVHDPDGHNRTASQAYQHYLQHYRPDVKAPTRYIQPFPMQPPIAVDDPEDDFFDVDSDREGGTTTSHLGDTPRNDLGLMLALSASQDDRSVRSITNFLDNPNVLATYQPTFTASPLMDPQTARVFCHFVTATAPSMSIFERHPTNPTVMFTGAPVPSSQQALWTYTLPMMALSHQGLLHAMLALASLHIARLQQTSPAPSLKHYHFALRRVAKAVGLPSKRHGIATLAATLLLGFYEATTAEHNKWNSHLAGARQLVMEIDFAGTTKQIKEQNAQAKANKYYSGFSGYQQPFSGHRFSDDVSLEVDNGLISTLMGSKSHFDQYGQIIDPTASTAPRMSPLTPKDIETYQIQRDLFWWYCKQDVFQSALSGNRLLMPYERWDHCPPRAPVGRLDAVYGTMDHLVLLLARIVDFAAKDQKRKSEAVEANGGQWKPPPGMFPSQPSGGPPQSGPPSQAQAPPTTRPNNPTPNNPSNVPAAAQGGPPMYGMIPPTGPVRIPTGFIQGPRDHILPTNLSNEDIELEAATLEAEAEWNNLRNTLDIFEESLGPNYQPLSPEHMQPLSTPFGPALYYRTYSISCIWTLFYMGRIIAARVHPSMPPAMMAAAGIAAPRTFEFATLIGRICAGLQPISATHPLNPSLGAALMESTLGLFFSAVQYRDAAQRGWTITKLRDIARLTGWQSSAAIAAGCETSWVKTYEAGRGPKYVRTMEPTARDDRVAGRRPWVDGVPPKDSNDRRFITVNAGTRVHWALGLLSMEEDMRMLSVSKTG